jgi:hypothetical protein
MRQFYHHARALQSCPAISPGFLHFPFKPVSPKIAPPLMASIIIPGKVYLDLTHKLRKAGQLVTPMADLAIAKLPAGTIKALQSRFNIISLDAQRFRAGYPRLQDHCHIAVF